MSNWAEWFRTAQVYHLPLTSIALALLLSLVFYLAMRGAVRLAVRRLQTLASRASAQPGNSPAGGAAVDAVEVLGSTSGGLIALAALLIGLGLLDVNERWNARIGQLWFVAVALQFGLWLTQAIGIALRRYQARHARAAGASAHQPVSASATLLSWLLRTVLWAVVLLAVLANLGVNITAFVASLGVGGIAIALAVQNILGDLFASLSIAVDKPFEVGDFIGVGDMVGTVQFIGLKTTRIRSLTGEQIIIGNTDLLKQVVKNYKRMEERRIVFKFGVAYSTTPEQAAQIPALVKQLVDAVDSLRFDRAHLLGFGESALDFEVVYIVKTPDYTAYMDAQQAINLGLMRALKTLGVAFAFPTRTLHIETGGFAGAATSAAAQAGANPPGARALGTRAAPAAPALLTPAVPPAPTRQARTADASGAAAAP